MVRIMLFRWLTYACLAVTISCPLSLAWGGETPGFLSQAMLASANEPIAKIPAGALRDLPPAPPSELEDEVKGAEEAEVHHVGDRKTPALSSVRIETAASRKEKKSPIKRVPAPIRAAAPPAELAPNSFSENIARPLQAPKVAASTAAEEKLSDDDAAAVAPLRSGLSAIETELVQERYPNGGLKIAKEIAQDEEGNLVRHGEWSMWATDGVLIAEGTFKRDKRHGKWKRMAERDESSLLSEEPYKDFQAPFLSEADFRRGELHGAWVIHDSLMRKVSQIDFQHGVRHGKARWWNVEGQLVREISFQHGLVDGDVLRWTNDGQLVGKETYLAGRKLAPKTEYYSDKKKKASGLVLSPRIVTVTPDDWWNIQLAQFEIDENDPSKDHGAQTHWHPNGQVRLEGVFEFGKPTGEFTWWYANGQKAAQGSYTAGRQTGVWIWWGANGLKTTAGEFVGGRPVEQWTWWQTDGKVSRRVNYSQQDTAPIAIRPTDPLQSGGATLR